LLNFSGNPELGDHSFLIRESAELARAEPGLTKLDQTLARFIAGLRLRSFEILAFTVFSSDRIRAYSLIL
jgi:hypothetical protein